MKNDTARVVEIRPATVGQLKDLLGLLAQTIPNELSFEAAKDVLSRKRDFIAHVQGFFPNPIDLRNPIKQWEQFYQKALGITVDLSGVKIPEKREGFDRLLIIAKGLGNNQVYEACAKQFPCWRYAEDLDKAVPTNERDPKNGAYAIWVRDVVEADEIHRNKSAKMVKDENLKTETLLERMLHELKYFLETGKHLDIQNWTMCSGSRDSGGRVPLADWHDGRFKVFWDDTARRSDYLRPREAITL